MESNYETFAQLFWQAHDTYVSWAAGDRAVGDLSQKYFATFGSEGCRSHQPIGCEYFNKIEKKED